MLSLLVDATAIAQTSDSLHPSVIAQTNSNPNQTVLLVSPTAGNDQTADGSDRTPFKTITRALQVAAPNTVILLIPGIYSAETGEVFPLVLKPGVTLHGNPQTRGQEVVIKGSGSFLSRFFARQDVTIVGANQAALVGLTVTNPDPEGYAVWIESTSPIVTDNTFTGSGHDGISVVGNSAPLIRNNFFYQNGANGITIYGTSRPEVRENIFERTGFAININQKAAPLMIGNRITQNKDGIVVQGQAQPILRSNSVEGNERDGLVAIAQSRPDLGTPAAPGGNLFRNNGQFDINAKATSQMIPAVGNELLKTVGQLDLNGTGQTIVSAPAFTPISTPPPAIARPPALSLSQPRPLAAQPLPMGGGQPFPARAQGSKPSSASGITAASFPVPTALSGKPAPPSPRPMQRVSFMAPSKPALPPPKVSPAPVGAYPGKPLSRSTAPKPAFPITAPPPRSQPARSPSTVTIAPPAARPAPAVLLIAPVRPPASRSIAIPIPVPPPESRSIPAEVAVAPAITTPSPPTQAPALLPVPSSDVPIGDVGGTEVNIYRKPSGPQGAIPSMPPTRTAMNLRYRVVVPTEDDRQAAQVQAIVPDAFRTFMKGRMVMQVGAFADRTQADALVRMLAGKGMSATIEQLE
jgi:parallel beta-helix repeat protein